MIMFSTKYDIRNIILSINPEYYKSHWYYEAYVTNKSKMVYLLNQRYTIFLILFTYRHRQHHQRSRHQCHHRNPLP